jgi:peptidoglycan/xylan/chitin deacetylase (PgdA/CDA1 family)
MQIPILMYHGISPASVISCCPWAISSSTFVSNLEFLKSGGYHPLTVSELVSLLFDKKGPLPVKPVVLTFDDGLADFFTEALPILDKFGYPATLYIPTSCVSQTCTWFKPSVGTPPPMMLSWSQIRQISDHGVECGSHGHSHVELDILPAKRIQEEIRISKDILEQHLQRSVGSISYPYGVSSAILRKIVKQAGFTSGCAVKHAMMTHSDDRYALARIMVTSKLTQSEYQDALIGKGLRKSHKDERIKTKIYRFVRKLRSRLKNGKETI